MRKTVRLISLAMGLGMLGLSQVGHAVTAGGIVSIQHAWPAGAQFDKLSFFQQINHDGGASAHYYWANQFYLHQGDGGYIGLQNRGNGVYAFNYSIWNAIGWQSGECNYFSHEGSGVQCQLEYPWKTGHQYRLDVIKRGNLVQGVVTDMMDGTSITVGEIEVPPSSGKLYASSGFVEEYSQSNGQLASCSVMGAQGSIFRNPVGDDKVTATQRTYTYGNCNDAYVVQAACNDKACINMVSNLRAMASPDAPTVPLVNSQNLSAQAIANALGKADLVVIRSVDGGWTPNIQFPAPSGLKWKTIVLDHRATYPSSVNTGGAVLQVSRGQHLMYTSDGNRWNLVRPD